MANEFVARKGIKILTISSGSTSNQVVVWNPTTNNLETRTDVGTSSGSVDASGFTGTPLAYTVNLPTAFASTDYSVVVTGGDARVWTVENLTTSSFVINSNSNTGLVSQTRWIATLNLS